MKVLNRKAKLIAKLLNRHHLALDLVSQAKASLPVPPAKVLQDLIRRPLLKGLRHERSHLQYVAAVRYMQGGSRLNMYSLYHLICLLEEEHQC